MILGMFAVILLLLRVWHRQRIVRRERDELRRHVAGGVEPWWGQDEREKEI